MSHSRSTSQILASVQKNNDLLALLSSSDYATSDLTQTTQYLLTLRAILAQETSKIASLEALTAKEHNEHTSYRDSVLKRLAYKFSFRHWKYTEKEEQEQREWLNAIQNELQAKRAVEHLTTNIKDAEAKEEELRGVVREHERAQRELDELYNSLFEGESPEFPDEDRKEQELGEAKREFDDAQCKMSVESQTVDILRDAQVFMDRCIRNLDEALQSSTSSIEAWGFGIGGGNNTISEMAERSALGQAQSHASQVEMLFGQARRLQPTNLIQPLGTMYIAHGNLMGDVVFDERFSEMKLRDRVEESRTQVMKAASRLTDELRASEDRLMALKTDTEMKKEVLEKRRLELQEERKAVFEKVVTNVARSRRQSRLSQANATNLHVPASVISQPEKPQTYELANNDKARTNKAEIPHSSELNNEEETPRSSQQPNNHKEPTSPSLSPHWDVQQQLHYSLYGGGQTQQTQNYYHQPLANSDIYIPDVVDEESRIYVPVPLRPESIYPEFGSEAQAQAPDFNLNSNPNPPEQFVAELES